jgi:hypothetical protein
LIDGREHWQGRDRAVACSGWSPEACSRWGRGGSARLRPALDRFAVGSRLSRAQTGSLVSMIRTTNATHRRAARTAEAFAGGSIPIPAPRCFASRGRRAAPTAAGSAFPRMCHVRTISVLRNRAIRRRAVPGSTAATRAAAAAFPWGKAARGSTARPVSSQVVPAARTFVGRANTAVTRVAAFAPHSARCASRCTASRASVSHVDGRPVPPARSAATRAAASAPRRAGCAR